MRQAALHRKLAEGDARMLRAGLVVRLTPVDPRRLRCCPGGLSDSAEASRSQSNMKSDMELRSLTLDLGEYGDSG